MSVRGLLVLVVVCSAAVAAPVPKSLKKKPDPFDLARFNVRYYKTPFETVLKHFADETGLEWVGDRPQLGTVTLRSSKEYTGAEFIDLLNERLELDNFILIRHAKTFYVHAAGEPIDVDRLDTISVEELVVPRAPVQRAAVDGGGGGGQWINGQWVPSQPVAQPQQAQAQAAAKELPPPPPPKRGKTELATAVIPLSAVAYADVRPQVLKSMSKFGQGVEACDDGRAMRVTDRVDNLRFIERVVNERPTACYTK
jgi:hypothetical protein